MIEIGFLLAFLIFTVVTNYHSLKRVYEVTTLMAHSLDVVYPSTVSVVKHHLFMIFGILFCTTTFQVLLYMREIELGFNHKAVWGWLLLR